MTTAAQVKKMVQPVLARHPDLALVGRWIYVKPVHHFARAVLIGRTAYAEEFEPQWVLRAWNRWITAREGGDMTARAFSGEVETGSPQKMRPLKDN